MVCVCVGMNGEPAPALTSHVPAWVNTSVKGSSWVQKTGMHATPTGRRIYAVMRTSRGERSG